MIRYLSHWNDRTKMFFVTQWDIANGLSEIQATTQGQCVGQAAVQSAPNRREVHPPSLMLSNFVIVPLITGLATAVGLASLALVEGILPVAAGCFAAGTADGIPVVPNDLRPAVLLGLLTVIFGTAVGAFALGGKPLGFCRPEPVDNLPEPMDDLAGGRLSLEPTGCAPRDRLDGAEKKVTK